MHFAKTAGLAVSAVSTVAPRRCLLLSVQVFSATDPSTELKSLVFGAVDLKLKGNSVTVASCYAACACECQLR